jgi:hypothetical protein
MNTLLRKEFRLLLPAWLAALAVAMLPLLLRQGGDEDFYAVCFAAGALFLGLTPFGQEVNWGTFCLLLSQPEKRGRLWNAKAGLSALAFFCGWAVFNYCHWLGVQHPRIEFPGNPASVADTALMSAVVALVAYSGGLWTTLLLRDVAAALITTILVPVFIYEGVAVGLGGVLPAPGEIGGVALVLYAVAGLIAARRLFIRAQDLSWAGGQISVSDGQARPFHWLAFGFKQRRGALPTLIFKELQLQEITMILTPVLLVVHLTVVLVRHFAPSWGERFYLNDVVHLWLVLPLVIGSLGVAEERRHNTWEAALCLPVPRRLQLAVKFGVVMMLGVILGGVLPSLVEGAAGASGFFKYMPYVAAGTTAVSFLASTMSRGLLQCFSVAALSIVGALFLFALALLSLLALLTLAAATNVNLFQVGGALFAILAWPAGIALYVFLIVKNCQQTQIGARLWWANVRCVAGVIFSTLLATAAIYERVWEFAMPLEPRHGPPRLAGGGRPMLAANAFGHFVYALLPDGRLWCGQRNTAQNTLTGQFGEGANWVWIVADWEGDVTALGIKSDGTLWKFLGPAEPSRVGTDTNWKKVIAPGSCFLALKQNGQVWVFSTSLNYVMNGTNDPAPRSNPTAGALRPLESVQLGNDSDWRDIHVLGYTEAGLSKNDGTFWGWTPAEHYPQGKVVKVVRNQLRRLPSFDSETNTTSWRSLATGAGLKLAIRADGTLWAGINNLRPRAEQRASASGALVFSTALADDRFHPFRVGTRSDWVTLSSSLGHFVATEADGTLLAVRQSPQVGDFPMGQEVIPNAASLLEMKHPSRYHDWLAATAAGEWALARDGTLSCWRNPFDASPDQSEMDQWIRLRPSRRPLASVNIFDAK